MLFSFARKLSLALFLIFVLAGASLSNVTYAASSHHAGKNHPASHTTTATSSTESNGQKKPKLVIQPPSSYLTVTPLDILHNPTQYLEKGVAFDGTFNTFSAIGLDYKRAFRDSTDFITLLINRPDVTNGHTIPLSELKLFYPRKESEAVMHLESGDKIAIKGKVFSDALGDAWVDVIQLKVLSSKKPAPKKAEKS